MVCSGCFEWDQLARQGTTPFVEPEVVSGAAFAKGFGGCNDWHSWFDTAEGTEVSFSQFTDGERVYSDKRMHGAATAAFGFATWDRSGDEVATKVTSAASSRVMVGGPAPETLQWC